MENEKVNNQIDVGNIGSDWKEIKRLIIEFMGEEFYNQAIAPLLQKECKGDDLVAEQPVSSKMEHTEMGGSSENGRWVNRREREPEKTGKYKIRYGLTDFDDSFEEAEETYYNQSGWNKHGYAQFVMAWWEESNTKDQEEKYYPDIQYQRLFNAISETKGIATQSDMDEIIRIVHEDFPLWISVNDRLPDCKDKSTAYDGLFSERVLIVEEHQNKQRIDISNCRLDDINVDGFIAYKQQAPTHKWGVQGNNMNVTHWMPLPKSPTELVNLERNASPRTHNQGDEAGNKNKTSNSEATILSAPEILKKYPHQIIPRNVWDEKNNSERKCSHIREKWIKENDVLAAMEEYKNQFDKDVNIDNPVLLYCKNIGEGIYNEDQLYFNYNTGELLLDKKGISKEERKRLKYAIISDNLIVPARNEF